MTPNPKYPSDFTRRHLLRSLAAARTPPGPQWPSGLVRRNQKHFSDRCGWPRGVLLTCWRLQHRYPGWHVTWLEEWTTPGWERPAGFWATNTSVPQHPVEAFRVDAAELESVLAAGVPEHEYGTANHLRPCGWCLEHRGARPAKL